MALLLSTDLKNYAINQGFVKAMSGTVGTGGSAILNIFSGPQAVSADTGTNATNNVLLCRIIAMGWSGGGTNSTTGATAGTAILANTTGYGGTALTSGIAAWARMETFGTGVTGSAGTFRIDGDVGTSGTSTFVINSTTITVGGMVTILACPISLG